MIAAARADAVPRSASSLFLATSAASVADALHLDVVHLDGKTGGAGALGNELRDDVVIQLDDALTLATNEELRDVRGVRRLTGDISIQGIDTMNETCGQKEFQSSIHGDRCERPLAFLQAGENVVGTDGSVPFENQLEHAAPDGRQLQLLLFADSLRVTHASFDAPLVIVLAARLGEFDAGSSHENDIDNAGGVGGGPRAHWAVASRDTKHCSFPDATSVLNAAATCGIAAGSTGPITPENVQQWGQIRRSVLALVLDSWWCEKYPAKPIRKIAHNNACAARKVGELDRRRSRMFTLAGAQISAGNCRRNISRPALDGRAPRLPRGNPDRWGWFVGKHRQRRAPVHRQLAPK